jgi:uncharacterized protein (TIGR00730 family)
MHERKKIMMDKSDCCVALPGGVGTFEELLEAITWRKIKIIDKPIFIVNTLNYYDDLIKMLEKSMEENFLDKKFCKLLKLIFN